LKSMVEQAVAEFIGTFALIFIGAGSVVVLSLAGPGAASVIGIALAHGLVLGVMISNLGHISGGHFNPAVTIGAWVVGKIESARVLVYLPAQAAGAAAGAGVLRLAMPHDFWKRSFLGATTVAHAAGINNGKAVLIEGVLTFFLVFTVFAMAVDDRGVFGSIAGLGIGLVLTFDMLMGGLWTGASMNPARSFGPALMAAHWDDFWVYVAGPLTGGILAAIVYWVTYLREREVSAPRTETPIGGGVDEEHAFAPEDELP
jgi:MIP family channel proteins